MLNTAKRRYIVAGAASDHDQEHLDALRFFHAPLDLNSVLDLDGRILRANAQWEEALGYSRAELEGLFLLDLVHPEDRNALVEQLEKAPFQQLVDFTQRYLHKDGSFRFLEWRSIPIEGRIYAIARDITIWKFKEMALEESEFKARAFFNVALGFQGILSPDGRVLDINQAALDFVGCKLEDVAGKAFWTCPWWNHAPDVQVRLQLYIAQAAAGELVRFEETNRSRQGQLHAMDCSLKPVINEAGAIILLIAEGRNITQRKIAEERLRKSEQRLRSLFEGSPIGIFHSTPEGEFTQVNQAIANMLGYEDPATLMEAVNPLGITTALYDPSVPRNVWIQELEAHMGRWLTREMPFRRKDGSTLHVIISSMMLPDPETGKRILSGFVQDISQRKDAEREIRNLRDYLARIIDAMPSMLIGLDAQGRINQWNQAAMLYTGVSPETAMGKAFNELLPEFEPWIDFETDKNRVIAKPFQEEKIRIPKDGTPSYFNLMAYPLIENASGPQNPQKVHGSVIRIEDVTEATRIQDLIIQAEKMLSLGGLAAGMAHEINNPLGIISQAAQNIERRLSAPLPANEASAREVGFQLDQLQAYFHKRQIPEFLESIHDAVNRANRIVGNMLQFSRKSEPVKQAAAVSELMEKALELAQSDIHLKKHCDFNRIQILRDFEVDLPLIPMVVIEIEQVFINLIRNAAEALALLPHECQPVLRLHIRKEDRHILIEIQDNGPGMEANIRRRVFEPFFTTKAPGLGTGLGLSVSYMIITQYHKGLIEVESAPGAGTRFKVRLPLEGGASHV